ncbi:hypothetical protein RUND412_003330 [Rhizina undulata]
MDIKNLPADIFADVIDALVRSIGIYKAVRLRTVNKLFDYAILRAIFDSQVVNFHDPVQQLPIRRMCPPIVARLLFVQTKNNPNRSHVLFAISRAVQALAGPQTDEVQRLERTRAICEAAVDVTVQGKDSWEILRETKIGYGRVADSFFRRGSFVGVLL